MCKETLKIYQASLKGYVGPSSQKGGDDDTKHNVKVGNEDGEINQKAEDRPPTRHIGHEMLDAGSSQTMAEHSLRREKINILQEILPLRDAFIVDQINWENDVKN